MSFNQRLVQLFSGKDNNTLDLGRVLWGAGVVVFFILSLHFYWHGQSFDPIAWSTGFGTVLAAGAGALLMKRTTEPEPNQNNGGG